MTTDQHLASADAAQSGHREGSTPHHRVVRVRVPTEVVEQAHEYHRLWQRALREAREMMHSGLLDDMYYEMRLYDEVQQYEPILQAACWAAFRGSHPGLRSIKRAGRKLLYLVQWESLPCSGGHLLGCTELYVSGDEADLIYDKHSGPCEPSWPDHLCICSTEAHDELELVLLKGRRVAKKL